MKTSILTRIEEQRVGKADPDRNKKMLEGMYFSERTYRGKTDLTVRNFGKVIKSDGPLALVMDYWRGRYNIPFRVINIESAWPTYFRFYPTEELMVQEADAYERSLAEREAEEDEVSE